MRDISICDFHLAVKHQAMKMAPLPINVRRFIGSRMRVDIIFTSGMSLALLMSTRRHDDSISLRREIIVT